VPFYFLDLSLHLGFVTVAVVDVRIVLLIDVGIGLRGISLLAKGHVSTLQHEVARRNRHLLNTLVLRDP
jgi:hypothetical protein